MSTRKKKGGAGFLNSFLTRSVDMREPHDRLILTMRMAREMLASGDGTAETWIELAGLLNVCGLYANDKNNEDWYAVLQVAANALREIEERHRRVGGRYAGKPLEVDAITLALNLIDYTILPVIPMVEFIHYADKLNKITENETKAEALLAADRVAA